MCAHRAMGVDKLFRDLGMGLSIFPGMRALDSLGFVDRIAMRREQVWFSPLIGMAKQSPI